MCDTLAAMPDATAAGAMLFAKNSDRERNEAQRIEMLPRRRPSTPTEQLTYVEIEAAEHRWREALRPARRGPSSIGRPAALAWARLGGLAGLPAV